VRNYAPGRYPWKPIPDFRPPTRRALKGRLENELRIISETGYAGYFLIFHDIVQACRARNIPVLARGSAAGSLICYCLGVSNVCPFRFGLSFERFLNHERLRHSKLPDIDLDLPWDRRDEIIAYVYEKFGSEHVAMIGGFNTFKARAAIAEIGKTMGLPESVVRQWTRFLPHGSLKTFFTRREVWAEARDLAREEQFDEAVALAHRLDGLPRHPMMHPCGIVVADRPLTDFMPLDPSNKGFAMTQMAMEPVEDLGLLKLDLLGQAGLSVLRDAVATIEGDAGIPFHLRGASGSRPEEELPDLPGGAAPSKSREGTGPNTWRRDAPTPQNQQPGTTNKKQKAPHPLEDVNYHDPRIFDLVKSGNARGVFHIESPAMTSLLKLCRCSDIDCLVATVSVIRPGAANEDKKRLFARRYLGLEPPHFHHPDLEPILAESYGLMIYEEHIIMVAHHWAGMDLGQADLLRRILIKKKEGEALEELGREFTRCAHRKGYEDSEILTVWEMLVAFSGYMFNKAHGAAYAVEAFQGCWLKLHWPVHFLAAVLQNQRGFYNPMVYFLEAVRLGARFQLPDVNHWNDGYRTHTRPGGPVDVYIPLWQIKGLSDAFLTRWAREAGERRQTEDGVEATSRHDKTPRHKESRSEVAPPDGKANSPSPPCFATFEDFLHAVQPAPADLMLLARAGALDSFFENRHAAVWEAARSREPRTRDEQAWMPIPRDPVPALPPDNPRERATWEQELIGFPVSLDPYAFWLGPIDRVGTVPIHELADYVGQEVEVAGIIVATRNHMTVKATPMKFLSLADETGMCETTLFPRAYQKYGYEVSRAVAIRARLHVQWDDTESGLSCDFVSLVANPPTDLLAHALGLPAQGENQSAGRQAKGGTLPFRISRTSHPP
jgi:DNA polymerase III alpha subunit